jgi:hypothetical protein
VISLNPQPKIEQVTTGLTIEAWVSLPVVDASYQRVVTYGSPTAPAFMLRVASNAVPQFQLQNINGAYWNPGTTTTLHDHTTYHLVATYDGVTLLVYVNGNTDPTGSRPGDAAINGFDPTYGLAIGGDLGSIEPLAGTIDEVAIYDHALDAGTIERHYCVGAKLNGPPCPDE